MSARRPLGAPIGREFLAVCERIDPESESLYRKVCTKASPPSLATKRAPRSSPPLLYR
jgi:hypothetical protein